MSLINWPCGCMGTNLKEYTEHGCPEHGKAPDRLKQIVKELFTLVDKIESNDDGDRIFFPTELRFHSCRAMDSNRIGQIIDEMKQIVGVSPRMTEKEMFIRNHPDKCAECLGEGYKCKVCKGSGSNDPTVPTKDW